jgi:hypothetical protein
MMWWSVLTSKDRIQVKRRRTQQTCLSSGSLRRVLCGLDAYLDYCFGLFSERVQLLTHKLGLDFHNVLQIFRLTKFLYKSDSSRKVFPCIAQKFFI